MEMGRLVIGTAVMVVAVCGLCVTLIGQRPAPALTELDSLAQDLELSSHTSVKHALEMELSSLSERILPPHYDETHAQVRYLHAFFSEAEASV